MISWTYTGFVLVIAFIEFSHTYHDYILHFSVTPMSSVTVFVNPLVTTSNGVLSLSSGFPQTFPVPQPQWLLSISPNQPFTDKITRLTQWQLLHYWLLTVNQFVLDENLLRFTTWNSFIFHLKAYNHSLYGTTFLRWESVCIWTFILQNTVYLLQCNCFLEWSLGIALAYYVGMAVISYFEVVA